MKITEKQTRAIYDLSAFHILFLSGNCRLPRICF